MKNLLFTKSLSFDKETAKSSEKLTKKAKEKGRSVGRNNPPKADSNILQIAFVVYIINNCGQIFNKLFGFVEDTLQLEYTRYQQIIKEYTDNNIFNNLQKEKKRLHKAMKKALKEVSKFIKKQVKEAKKEIKELKNKVEKDKIVFEEMKYTKVFWPILISVLLIVGILASEAFVNQKAFLFMKGENFITSLIIAIGISFCTFLLGMGVARIFQNKSMELINKVIFIGILVGVALGAYYGIAVLRVSMMESLKTGSGRGAFIVSKSTLLMINFGFFVSLILVKIYLFPKPEIFQANAEYKALKKLIAQSLAKIAKLKNEIKNAHNLERAEKDKVRKDFTKQMAEIDKELQAKKEALKKHQVAYNRTLSIGYNLREELLNLALKAIGIYIEEINAFRSDGVVLEMPTEEINFSNNPLKDYEFINDTEVETLFDNYTDINPFTNNKTNNDENNDFEIAS